MKCFTLSKIYTALTLLSLPITKAESHIPSSSSLYLAKHNTSFSLSVDANSQDIYFRLESPRSASWVAVGVGDGMKGSLMVFVYAGENSKNVTISPRISTGTSEPKYTPDIKISALSGTMIQGNMYLVSLVCHNCRTWPTGSLNVLSTTQPWMYAFGPSDKTLTTNDLAANLAQHVSYGRFTVDMPHATGNFTGIPPASTVNSGVLIDEDRETRDGDHIALVHGYIMAALILVCTPLLFLHITSQARMIWITSAVFGLVLVVGYVCGIWDSSNYLRSKSFKSDHQVIGFIVLGLFLLVLVLKFVPAKRFRNDLPGMQNAAASMKKKSALMGLGHFTWLLGLINGFLGIRLAGEGWRIYTIYACIAIGMVLIFTPLSILLKRRAERRTRSNNVAAAAPMGNPKSTR
ncbi:hypothetical protein BGZ60DRAFT_16143 [Tricladium varicosporioides]|nr:hypothetical protein BGZ60DRAFT_16143 [Hymenoscyphus varicosporioides]